MANTKELEAIRKKCGRMSLANRCLSYWTGGTVSKITSHQFKMSLKWNNLTCHCGLLPNGLQSMIQNNHNTYQSFPREHLVLIQNIPLESSSLTPVLTFTNVSESYSPLLWSENILQVSKSQSSELNLVFKHSKILGYFSSVTLIQSIIKAEVSVWLRSGFEFGFEHHFSSKAKGLGHIRNVASHCTISRSVTRGES